MLRVNTAVALALALFMPLASVAEEQISFKGIKFGMDASQIANLAGGDSDGGCFDALPGRDSSEPWTYGGLTEWRASCAEGSSAEDLGYLGLYRLITVAGSEENGLARMAGWEVYSMEQIAEVFSQVFGKFMFHQGRPRRATATRGGAVIEISESDDLAWVTVEITSVNYLAKQAALEKKKESKKLDGAKSDF